MGGTHEIDPAANILTYSTTSHWRRSRYDTAENMTGFMVKYYFDGEGKLLYLKEITTLTLESGEKKEYSYSIYITERNEIERVDNPIDVSFVEDSIM